MKSAQDLINENNQLRNKMYEYEDIIRLIKKRINSNEKDLWEKCNHEWERDFDAAFDDNCKHFCKKCKLWRNSYFYNTS